MTEYAVVLPLGGSIKIMKADKVVERWQREDIVEILGAAERIARKEWGEDLMLYFARFEEEVSDDGGAVLISYQIYVED